jgi:hypothetical protein
MLKAGRLKVVLAGVVLSGISGCGVPGMDEQFVSDALRTGAYEIRRSLQDNPGGMTAAEVEAVFVRHHKASVSPIWLDADGRPVDAWGTHFRVAFGGEGPGVWVRCDSAGPDRAFGTSDDLSFEAREP